MISQVVKSCMIACIYDLEVECRTFSSLSVMAVSALLGLGIGSFVQ